MIEIKIESELPSLEKQLERIEPRQWPFVLSRALNASGKEAKKHLQEQIPRFIDRPVPYTLSAVNYSRATRDKLESIVSWKSTGRVSGASYLAPLADGGGRKLKGIERALQSAGILPRGQFLVPTSDLELDQYGNPPRALYQQILSSVGAITSQMRERKIQGLYKRKGLIDAAKAINAQPKKRFQKYFAITDGGLSGALRNGIYERRSFAHGVGIRRIFSFTTRMQYGKQFPFEAVMQKKAAEVFPNELQKAIDKAIETSR